jgi:hypothetical protein
MTSEQEAIDYLCRGEVHLDPLTIELVQVEPLLGRDHSLDAVVQVRWHENAYDFGLEYTPYPTPLRLRQTISQVEERARAKNLYPMVLSPFLSEEKLRALEARGVSGLDLCGNGIVVVPRELLVLRTGAPNRFPSSAPIKNVYRGATSLVPRVFLLSPSFVKVTDIADVIRQKGSHLSLASVSKALKGLEEDLVIGRGGGNIRLLQPAKLLDRLAQHFRAPQILRQFRGKFAGQSGGLLARVRDEARKQGLRLALTGAYSALVHSVVARGDVLPFYCSGFHRLIDNLPVEETDRFPDLQIYETADETVFFDLRDRDGYPWSSPVQTYLELMHGDQRDRQTAEQVRHEILESVESAQR